MPGPTIVSGFGGGQYYANAARRLKADCKNFDLQYFISEWEDTGSSDWITLCRRKVAFYRDCLRRYPEGILCLDVDIRIIAPPTFISNLTGDFAAFLRSFSYLRDFDSADASRFFVPGVLFFGNTTNAHAFLDTMAEIDIELEDKRVTDDYILEEAWRRHQKELLITLLPPQYLQLEWEKPNPNAMLFLGESGNATQLRPFVEQQQASPLGVASEVTGLRRLVSQARRRRNKDAERFLLETMYDLPLDDQSTLVAATRSSKGRGRAEKVRALFQRYSGHWQVPFLAKRAWLENELRYGDLALAETLCADLALSPSDEDRTFGRSRRYRIDLEQRARQMGLDREARPGLSWIERPFPGNFGDTLNPYIVERLSGLPPRHVPFGESGSILAVGSTVRLARAGTKVWGAGIAYASDAPHPDAEYRAVRGPLTRQAVIRSGGSCPELYGDPAFFLPTIYRPASAKRHELGLIRHVRHRYRSLALDGVYEIEIARVGDVEIEQFIDEVVSCETIVSTSLHGLIVAHAFGVPAAWATFDDGLARPSGDSVKFYDYFLSIGYEEIAPVDLAALRRLDGRYARSAAVLPRKEIDLGALAKAAPFELMDASATWSSSQAHSLTGVR